MVKIPEKAPDWQDFLKKDFKEIYELSTKPIIQQLIEKTDQRYYYWDKIRSQPLPSEFDKKEVWSFIRLRRHLNSSALPVLDIKNHPFTFWLTEDMQKNLHFIDQSTAGNLELWETNQDKKTSAKFMIASLMEEAITSSQIEGAVATIKDAKKMLLEKRNPKNKSEQMIFNNFATMQALKKLCKQDLTMQLLLEMHISITKDTLDDIQEEGRFRTPSDNVSVITTYGEVLFTPPAAEEIQQRLHALIQFANDKTDKPFIHPVVKATILHFWMAYIHPFTDGNGRMARTLFYWYMLKHNYWLFEYTSISKIILDRTTKYANAYLYSEHDGNDLTYFIHFHLDIIISAIEELKSHIQKESQSQREVFEYPDLNLRQARIIQHIKAHPHDALSIKIHQNLNNVAYETARTDLLELEEKGWLKSIKKGKKFFFIPITEKLNG